MNPLHKIGRHQLPLFNVASITERGWFRLRHPFCPYAVLLSNGQTIYFTKKEKAEYDDAVLGHAKIIELYGMARSFGAPI